jgi:hypothetical protein
LKVALHVILIGSNLLNLDETFPSLIQVTLLHKNDAKVVTTLNVTGVDFDDLLVTFFSGLQVLHVIGVDVAHEDEAFDVVGVVVVKALQEREGVEGALLFVEKEREVEERAPQVWFGLDCFFEPEFSVGRIAVIHSQHSKIEVNTI